MHLHRADVLLHQNGDSTVKKKNKSNSAIVTKEAWTQY